MDEESSRGEMDRQDRRRQWSEKDLCRTVTAGSRLAPNYSLNVNDRWLVESESIDPMCIVVWWNDSSAEKGDIRLQHMIQVTNEDEGALVSTFRAHKLGKKISDYFKQIETYERTHREVVMHIHSDEWGGGGGGCGIVTANQRSKPARRRIDLQTTIDRSRRC